MLWKGQKLSQSFPAVWLTDMGKLCPDWEQLLLPGAKAVQLLLHSTTSDHYSQSDLLQPALRRLCSWSSARSGRSELEFAALLLTLHLQHTQTGHKAWSPWPTDLLVISRKFAKLPCKLHGFATYFCCRWSLPTPNVPDPIIKAYFDLPLRNGSLKEEVRKPERFCLLQRPDFGDRNARAT